MKVKSRRSASRVGTIGDEAGPSNIVEFEDFQSIKRQKNVDTSRPSKSAKKPNPTLTNGALEPRPKKKKRIVTANGGPTSLRAAAPHQSNSCSSASSIVSGAGDPDPYEFAVKTDEEPNDCTTNSAHTVNSGSTSAVPPMKRMKLERMEERCLSDSTHSSPLPQSTLSQPSPGSHSSPLNVHCTRPLSVLTDFSSPIHRSNADLDPGSHLQPPSLQQHHRMAISTCVSYPSCLDALTVRHTSAIMYSNASLPSPSGDVGVHADVAVSRADTPLTTPAVETVSQSRPPQETKRLCSTEMHATSPPGTPCSVACSTPTTKHSQRSVGVNTVLDSCKATITEPDLLGPCEPGTTISLNGIVWLETTTGVLVVNVTWRGRTYIGTLLDATQHDFAPPCPRDYVPAFKSNSIRSSNRTKRRACLGTSYKQPHYNSASANLHESHGKSSAVGGGQRHRLRGRNTSSPLLCTQTATNATAVTSKDTCTSLASASDGVFHPAAVSEQDGSAMNQPVVKTRMDDEEHSNPILSDEELTLDSSSGRIAGPKQNDSKRGSSSSSSDCPSECLHEVDKSDRTISMASLQRPAESCSTCDTLTRSTIGRDTDSTPVGVGITRKQDAIDDELGNSFPITCPIDGCKKRFTHMIALRFHLDHTRHDCNATGPCNSADAVPVDRNSIVGCDDLIQSRESPHEHDINRNTESPPIISPPCSRTPNSHSNSPFTLPMDSHPNGADGSHSDHLSAQDKEEVTHNFQNLLTPNTGVKPHADVGSFNSHASDSLRSHPKVATSATFIPGPLYDTAGTGSTMRTVTAHTVSVPHGVTSNTDGCHGLRPSVTHSSGGKQQRPSSGMRTDLHKSRSHFTKSSSHSNKGDLPNTGSSRRSLESIKDQVDCHNLPPFISRSTSNPNPPTSNRIDTSSADSGSASQFASNLAFISRESAGGNTLPITNQLPLGMWNLSSLPNTHALVEQQQRSVDVHETVQHLDGIQLNGTLAAHNRTISNLQFSSGMNLTNYVPSLSGTRTTRDTGHPVWSACPNTRPASNHFLDPSSFYGLPDFLVAAAMNALTTDGTGTSLEAATRSYPASICNPALPKLSLLPHFPIVGASAEHALRLPNPIATNQSSQLPTPPLASMFTGTGPPLLPSTALHGLPGLTSTSSSSNFAGHADRFDPFRLSAACLMQQAVTGAQIPSAFGQQST